MSNDSWERGEANDRAAGETAELHDEITALRALIQQAEWGGHSVYGSVCPWCDELGDGSCAGLDAHATDCPAALAMNWKRDE